MTLDTLKREVSDKWKPTTANKKAVYYEAKNGTTLYYHLDSGEYLIMNNMQYDITDDFKELKDIMERVELLEYVRGTRQ